MNLAETYLLALAVTLATELPIIWAFYRRRVQPAWHLPATALVVNLFTHGLLWTLWRFLPGSYEVRLVYTEVVIWLAEALVYRAMLRGSWGRALLASLVANGVSVAVGLAMGL